MNAIVKDVLINTDKKELDLNYIHAYLSNSYWAKDRTKENMLLSIDNSICFGVYLDKKQIGFARLVTDYAVFAYLMDVFIDDAYKGQGYGSILLDHILGLPEFRMVENWKLATLDAHDFYAKKGFGNLKNPNRIMEKYLKI
jgi:GNAT superfamily N-acetyltransferase